jgi:hypothetical protein
LGSEEFLQDPEGELQLLRVEVFGVEVLGDGGDDILYVAAADRVAQEEGAECGEDFGVELEREFDGQQEGDEFIKDGVVELHDLFVPLEHDAEVEGVELVDLCDFGHGVDLLMREGTLGSRGIYASW